MPQAILPGQRLRGISAEQLEQLAIPVRRVSESNAGSYNMALRSHKSEWMYENRIPALILHPSSLVDFGPRRVLLDQSGAASPFGWFVPSLGHPSRYLESR